MTKTELVEKLIHGSHSAFAETRRKSLLRLTKRELEHMLTLRESRRYRQEVELGTICTHDRQADVFAGQYKIVAFDDKTGTYTAENLEPSDELIAEATAYYLESTSPYLDYFDAFGPGRRRQTRQEALDEEILDRIERAGTTFRVRFVSATQYAAAF